MVFGSPEGAVIEHRTSRGGRWLRTKRTRVALWIAVVEGLLVAVHVIPWVAGILAAVLVVVLAFWVLRNIRSDTVHQLAWIAGVSQALVALVPVLVFVIGTLALIAVAILALAALAALFADRA
jgi:hypothetical protein